MSLLSRLRLKAAEPGKVAGRGVSYAVSPLLAAPTPPWRSKFVVAGIAILFCVLTGKAIYVQLINPEFYQRQGESRYAHTLKLHANRGRIVDRNGLILASSVPAVSIRASKKDMGKLSPQDQTRLAAALGMRPDELKRRLEANPRSVWLRRLVDESVWERVRVLNLPGLERVTEYKRIYPEGEAAAHVVGFTNVEDRGQEGIELAFEDELSGSNGRRRVIRDRLGRIVDDFGESIHPSHGRDIELTIDSKVQFFAYQRIRDAVVQQKAKAGSVVVLDTQTGEVLALANYPSYVPGERQRLSGEQLRNRAITDTFEPGSTMKPFIIGWALETGRVKPETPIETAPGRLTIAGATIRDAHPHGVLSVAEVLQKSSNVGTVKLAMTMQPREMHELFIALGFGQKPQIDFPGVATGRLRSYKTWRPIEQATMSYGYGLSVSLLQLARAYTVFGTEGQLLPVTLIRQPTSGAGMPVLSPQTVQAVRQMLQMAAGPGGTAPKAQTMGYSVGGKSGTAHKQEGRSYAGNKYRSWFVGLAPVNKPRIVVAVMVDEPSNGVYFGGAVAGPVFSEVVQQTLRMLGTAPDLEVKPQIVATQTAAAVEESF